MREIDREREKEKGIREIMSIVESVYVWLCCEVTEIERQFKFPTITRKNSTFMSALEQSFTGRSKGPLKSHRT